MAGFTDAAMRRLAARYGAALSFTEMTNAAGVIHDSARTWQLLETFPDEGPVVAHLYGVDPAVLAAAASRIAATGRFCGIDLNAGCPVRKIAARGAGAALMRDPARIGRIVAAVRAACDLPVSVKTRLGPRVGQTAVFDVLDAVTAAGAAFLAVHARFATQGHTGPVRLDLLAEVKRRAAIPVVGNGGIAGPADAARMAAATGVDAIMIGRAALGNPWVFRSAAAGLTAAAAGLPPPPEDRVPLEELRRVLFEHIEGAVALRRLWQAHGTPPPGALAPEQAAVVSFRCHFFRYLTGLKGASYARGCLPALATLDDVRRLVDACLEREAAYRQRH
jgi:nifR3 family TIM-barrel protein